MSGKIKDKSSRFGAGEYETIPKKGDPTSLKEMRSIFLQKLSDRVPEVSHALDIELLELYKQIPLFYYEADKKRRRKKNEDERKYEAKRGTWHRYNRPTWSHIETAWNDRSPEAPFEVKFDDYYAVPDKKHPGLWTIPIGDLPTHKEPNIALFVEKLFNWSRAYNLDLMWCREHAYETLDLWSHYQHYREMMFWAWRASQPPFTHSIILPDFDLTEFVFKFVTFYPSEGFRNQEKQKIMNEFENKLDKFLNDREETAKKEGWYRTPQKYGLHHFEWLVDYQVKKLSKNRLSKIHGVDRKTMIDGLNSAAILINLTLRK